MKTVNLDDLTTEAVTAALKVIDEALDGTTKRSAGPCGDELAGKLDDLIRKAIQAHMAHPDYASAFAVLS